MFGLVKSEDLIPRLLAAAGVAVGAIEFGQLIIPSKYRSLHDQVGAELGIDPNLLHALQLRENPQEDPRAVGINKDAAGNVLSRDHGLMQINDRNFAALGLTLDTVYDPLINVRAAATLLKRNRAAAPSLGILSQVSVYNAGFSAHRDEAGQLRAKQNAAGGFSNQAYVWGVFSWYIGIVLVSFAPIKTPGWVRA